MQGKWCTFLQYSLPFFKINCEVSLEKTNNFDKNVSGLLVIFEIMFDTNPSNTSLPDRVGDIGPNAELNYRSSNVDIFKVISRLHGKGIWKFVKNNSQRNRKSGFHQQTIREWLFSLQNAGISWLFRERSSHYWSHDRAWLDVSAHPAEMLYKYIWSSAVPLMCNQFQGETSTKC